MINLFRFWYKKIVIPLLEMLMGCLPRRIKGLMFVALSESLGVKNLRFDFPFYLGVRGPQEPCYLNIGHFEGDRSVMPFLFHKKMWELTEPQKVAQLMDPNKKYVLFDVGANFGYFSMQLGAILRENNKIHSLKQCNLLEPDPDILPILRKNISSLQISNVDWVITDKALGLEKGTAKFFIDSDNKTNNSLTAEAMQMAVSDVEPILVDVLRIDDLIKQSSLEHGDRIIYKSDLQGMDEAILISMPRSILMQIDIMIFEIWPSVSHKTTDNLSELKEILHTFDSVSLENAKGKVLAVEVGEIIDIASNASNQEHYNVVCVRKH